MASRIPRGARTADPDVLGYRLKTTMTFTTLIKIRAVLFLFSVRFLIALTAYALFFAGWH